MAAGLCHTAALQELWLKANPIGEQGASILAEAMGSNKALELLSLLGCGSIGDNGATALVQSLINNSSLKRLQLSEAFQTSCKHIQDYRSIAHRLNWGADFTQQSVVKIENKNVDCEVLGMYLFKATKILLISI